MKLRARLKDFSAAVKWLVTLDRHEFAEKQAYDAQIAHDNNDVRGCFAVVRALSGGKPRAHKTILKRMVKRLRMKIKEKRGGKSIGQRSARAPSSTFIIIDLGTHERCPELDLSLECDGVVDCQESSAQSHWS